MTALLISSRFSGTVYQWDYRRAFMIRSRRMWLRWRGTAFRNRLSREEGQNALGVKIEWYTT